MTGLLLQIGATKLAVSIVLAGAVWIVHRSVGRPSVSYPLWLVVLLTLLVPAVISLPVLPAEPLIPLAARGAGVAEVVVAEGTPNPLAEPQSRAIAQPILAILWLLGTVVLLGWTATRTIFFRRTLKRAVRPAPAWLRREVAAVGRDLGLSRMPELCTTNARVTPMVWWSGARVRMLIPSFLLADPGGAALRAILAHELAHVRRRDHLMRWVEWLACSVFWWNPVAWWARYQLRVAEESCCDALAVVAGGSCPRISAQALLQVVANASEPAGFRPPLPASAACGVGHTKALERRLRMIVTTDNRTPARRLVRSAGWVAVVCALPLGLIYCDRPTATEQDAAMDPAEGAALGTPDQVSAAVDEFVASLSRREAEIQEVIREAMESGVLSEGRGRELSAYVSGAASGRLARYAIDHDLPDDEDRSAAIRLIRESVELTRGIWLGDYSFPISTANLTDIKSAELRAALAEMQELIREIGQNRDDRERFGEWRGRVKELNARIRVAMGLGIKGQS